MSRIIAGIDPGVRTGLAIWHSRERRFARLLTCGIIEAQQWVLASDVSEVWFEDARLRDWFPDEKNSKKAIARLQGAGSVKRDCSIWQEFCEHYKIPFKAIKPAKGQTKWTAEYFNRLTGWEGRTSQHARDAAALVYGV